MKFGVLQSKSPLLNLLPDGANLTHTEKWKEKLTSQSYPLTSKGVLLHIRENTQAHVHAQNVYVCTHTHNNK